MNGAHFHLLINHLPILGLIFAIIVMVIGLILKSPVVRRVALVLFLVTGISALPTMNSGEDAEEVIEHSGMGDMCGPKCTCSAEMKHEMMEQKEHYIHEHEEKAEDFMPYMWALIALSGITLYMEWKKKSMAMLASFTVLLIGAIALYFAHEVGESGGEISHPEIRTEHAS